MANTGCINPHGLPDFSKDILPGSSSFTRIPPRTGCAIKVGLEVQTTWRRFRAEQAAPRMVSQRGCWDSAPFKRGRRTPGGQAHLSAPSLPSFPMALLFKVESLEWPSLTGGDSCQEKGVFHHYTGSLSPVSLAFTVCLPLNGPLL